MQAKIFAFRSDSFLPVFFHFSRLFCPRFVCGCAFYGIARRRAQGAQHELIEWEYVNSRHCTEFVFCLSLSLRAAKHCSLFLLPSFIPSAHIRFCLIDFFLREIEISFPSQRNARRTSAVSIAVTRQPLISSNDFQLQSICISADGRRPELSTPKYCKYYFP